VGRGTKENHDDQPRTSSLRAILALDALACLGMGAGLAALAPALAGLTDLPSAFVRAAGLALLPVGAFILWAASRRDVPAWAVALIVAGNAAWVVLSVALPLAGLVRPNALGLALLLGQAAAVAALAALEWSRRGEASGRARVA
jgi:hypothetical protein